MEKISKIVFIGAGNMATNLAIALHNKGVCILQVVSRTVESARELALKVNADFSNDFSEISQDADLYIISVTDSALMEISKNLNLINKMVVHTSGSIQIDVLNSIADNYGCFYPLQTFSKSEIIDFKNIPICIESNDYTLELELFKLGEIISDNVQKINSDQRKILHIAAVFACNFSSYMYLISNNILRENKLSFDLIIPLIERTAYKIKNIEPQKAITGPARRNDNEIIQNHLVFLKTHPDYFEIYKLLSSNIVKHFYDTKQ